MCNGRCDYAYYFIPLTHLSRMEFPLLSIGPVHLRLKGFLGGIFIFYYFFLNKNILWEKKWRP